MFRKETVRVMDQYQYPDNKPGDVDAFSREPFVVRFRADRTGRSPMLPCDRMEILVLLDGFSL